HHLHLLSFPTRRSSDLLSFLIESAGAHSVGFRAFAAAVLAFSNQVNRQIKASLTALQNLSQSEPVVRLRISLATYAPANDRKLRSEEHTSELQSRSELV